MLKFPKLNPKTVPKAKIHNLNEGLDPNFGYETKGTSESQFSGEALRATKFTCPENGVANSLTAYLKYYAACNIKFGIYTDNAGYPDALVDYTAAWAITSGWDNWKTLTLTLQASLTANTVYWLVMFNDSGTVLAYYVAGGTNQYTVKAQAWNGFPATFPAGGTQLARQYSIYCTYTAGAPPPPTVKQPLMDGFVYID